MEEIKMKVTIKKFSSKLSSNSNYVHLGINQIGITYEVLINFHSYHLQVIVLIWTKLEKSERKPVGI